LIFLLSAVTYLGRGITVPIANAFAYLIRPGKGVDKPPQISSNEIPAGAGKLNQMLEGIFSGESGPHDFQISFNPGAGGTQSNECRSLLLDFQKGPTLATGLPIAQRLQGATDNRSGIGLLFLLSGGHGVKKRVVVSRFPTDQAVLADASSGGLAVAFLEQVFIKRLSSYKALRVEHENPAAGFWKGVATDRQAGQSGEHISEYWLKEFLNADFAETPAQGTRRLAQALKDAIKANPSLAVKTEIAHASSLAPAVFQGKSLTINDFCVHFGFSSAAKETIQNSLPKPSLFGKMFKFDPAEFKIIAPYRTVELNTGAILTAPSQNFEDVFKKHQVGSEVEYTTRGEVRDQRLTKK
jgi:hypothetical protein